VATHRMIGEEIELLLPCVRVSRPDHHLWDLGGLLSLPCRSRLPDLISCASSVVLRHSCTMFISCLFAGLPSCDHESLIRCINIVTERRCIWISRLQTERQRRQQDSDSPLHDSSSSTHMSHDMEFDFETVQMSRLTIERRHRKKLVRRESRQTNY
jgi:hypothetical protein